jgi:hypothetical protein
MLQVGSNESAKPVQQDLEDSLPVSDVDPTESQVSVLATSVSSTGQVASQLQAVPGEFVQSHLQAFLIVQFSLSD